MIFVANRVARADILQTHCGANVARQNFADFFTLVGVHLEQPANAFTSTADVAHRISGLKLTGIHANEMSTGRRTGRP